MSKGKTTKRVITEAEAPQAYPTEASSKAMMMANVVNGMAQMTPLDLSKFFTDWQAMIGHEADSIPNGAAAKNLASINSSQAVTEELNEILAGETLSEDIKAKTAVLFEAAVGTRVGVIRAEIEDEHDRILNEEIDEINETLTNQIDQYLTYVAEQWMKQNQAAVNSSIKSELAEDFIAGLYRLFSEHHVSIPENQIDVVESLTDEIANLREQLNIQIEENIQFSRARDVNLKEKVVAEITEGLAQTQISKIKKLAEGVDFGNDIEAFRNKVKILREAHFGSGKAVKPTKVLTEELVPEDKEPKAISPGLNKLRDYMENAVKN